MNPETLKKIKRIEITTRKVVNDVMTGNYKSQFKGHGVQFSEHRVYTPGDDVRHIDWKVSARTRDLLIKKFEEERELTVLILVDVSKSGEFGSTTKTKSEAIAELSGILAYAATQTGDRVGMVLFGGAIEKVIPPKKGRHHVMRLIDAVLETRSSVGSTALALALESAGRLMKHSGVIFILSDFIAPDYENPMKRLSRKHDVVALHVSDEREYQIPNVGTVLLKNPETGEETYVDTGSFRFKKWFEELVQSRKKREDAAFVSGHLDHLRIQTRDDYVEALVRFFRIRALKRR